MADDVIHYTWVVGRFIGEPAKSVLAHAHAMKSYYIMEQGKQGAQQTCMAAFIFVLDRPIPDHLTEVKDPLFINKLENWRRPETRERAVTSAKTVASIRSMFPSKQLKLPERADIDG